MSLLSISCNQKFNQEKWNEGFDGFYTYREKMIDDVMNNYLKNGMTKKEVIQLLEKPDYEENNKIKYNILVDYGWNIDPVETKNLCIYLSTDSLVKKINLEHWKQ